jgi:prepilin-type processing-associated H-X9-DG protein
MKKLLVLFCALSVIFCAAVVAAQDKMKPLVGDNTLAVIHVELDKIDVVKTLNNNRQEIEKMFAGLGLPEAKLHEILLRLVPQKSDDFNENWKALTEIADTGKKTLTETCGIQEAFIAVQVDKLIPVIGYIAIPKTENFKSEPLKQLLNVGDKLWGNLNLDAITRETDDYFFIAWTNAPTKEMKDNFAVNIGKIQPAERPDITAAFNAVKNEPVKIIFAIPEYTKKILAELQPQPIRLPFPSPENIDPAKFLNGIKFMVIGLNPEQGKMLTVVKTESENDAKYIAKQTDALLTTMLDGFLSDLEFMAEKNKSGNGFLYDHEIILLKLYPEVLNKKSIASLKLQLVPKPDGDTFTITLDAAKTGTLLIGSEIMLTKLVNANLVMDSVIQSRKQCANKMRQMVITILNYLDVYEKFPPAFSVDDNGKPLHSWRVMLLPFLGEVKLYESIRLNEPWDSEHNKQFHNKMPNAFKCPTCKIGNTQSDTVFCMVTGKEAFGKTDGKGITFRNIKDGASNTVCIVERKTPVCWMSPEDVTFENAIKGVNKSPEGIGSDHDRGTNVAFIDGSIQFLPQDTKPEIIKALLTTEGGEVINILFNEEKKK